MIDWSKVITAEDKAAQAHEDLLGKIAEVRFEHETAGIDLGGIKVATDRQSQSLVTSTAVSAMRNPNYTARWKAKTGFVSLDAATVLAVADAVRDHVQACFSREDELIEAVKAGTFEDRMLDEGWPK